MKNLGFILSLSIAYLFSFATLANNREHFDSADNSFVVVIGAFAIQKNAERFTERAKKLSYSAQYEFNPNRNLYYVYTLTTSDKAQAMEEARRMRLETGYTDAWVYQRISGEPISDSNIIPSPEPVVVTEPDTTQIVKSPDPNPEAPIGTKFIFKIFKAINNEPLEGYVDVIDDETSKKIGTYKGNAHVIIPPPTTKYKKLSFVCRVFGYRKSQRDLDFSGRMGEDIAMDADHFITMPFELVRLQKGDIEVMYNVFFFRDAAVMMPESQFEVNSLLDMMKENPKAKIRIHGHTNGNASGKIISMGESKKFFSLSGSKDGFGSAVQLSKERANVIKDYLVSNGIAPERLEVKAWGGKRALYDKESAKAKENVRVEIELLEDK